MSRRIPNQPGSSTTTLAQVRRTRLDLSLDSAASFTSRALLYFGPGDVSQRAPVDVLDRLFIPILWIIWALIAPTPDAASRAATFGV